MENAHLMPFEGTGIRKVWHNGEWYFSVVDVIRILTESQDARNYWKVLKNRESQLVTVCNQLKMPASDGRNRLTDCANTEGVLRIAMSVPSPKAEPLPSLPRFSRLLASLRAWILSTTRISCDLNTVIILYSRI